MSDEGVTYVELKLSKSKKPAGKRHPAHKKKEFPWHIVAINLGVLCFLLLLTSSFLAYHLWRKEFQKCPKSKNMNSSEENSTLSSENENYNNPTRPSTTVKKNASETCHGECSYCVKHCYYISTKEKTWEESKKACQVHGYGLIKIDDKDEQNFIRSKLKYNFWIGMKREKKEKSTSWYWLDGSEVSLNLDFQPPINIGDSVCGFIKPSLMSSSHCANQYPYICEKTSYLDN